VGTTMYRVGPERAWNHIDEWESDIARDWGGHTATEIRPLMYDLTPLRLQERARQNRLKLSFYLPLHADIDQLEAAIRARIEPIGIRARLVWSVDDVADIGLLDVLPERASKRHAIEALMQFLGVEASRTVFSGDSGNDLEVLISPIPSVLVANARSDVQELALELASEEGTLDRLYIARGGFLGMDGNYSAGVLEGIVHYHPELAPWFEESAA
jgi:hydroxymethylpyrimidine pyrophosphatase-like HAD family hydrolase